MTDSHIEAKRASAKSKAFIATFGKTLEQALDSSEKHLSSDQMDALVRSLKEHFGDGLEDASVPELRQHMQSFIEAHGKRKPPVLEQLQIVISDKNLRFYAIGVCVAYAAAGVALLSILGGLFVVEDERRTTFLVLGSVLGFAAALFSHFMLKDIGKDRDGD